VTTRIKPQFLVRVLAAASMALTAGCATTPDAPAEGQEKITVKSCVGKEITFDRTPERAVTMDGWAAQAMARLGLTDLIVGTGFTGPLKAEHEPFRGRLAKVPVITDQIPGVESVAARQPDVVLTSFSAFGGGGGPTDADLATMGAPGIAGCVADKAKPMTDLSATYDYLRTVGRVFRHEDRADALIAELEAREAEVRKKASSGRRLRVLALADSPAPGQPVKALGGSTPANALIHLAGGTNVFSGVDGMHADVSPEKIAALDPEVIWVVTDFSFAKTKGKKLVEDVRANPLLASTAAARKGRIISTSQYVVGFPSALNLDGLEQLSRELRP
jgi:iron complex transport system substrate-binding protein